MKEFKGKSFPLFSRFLAKIKNTKERLAPPEEDDVNQQLVIQLNKKKLPNWSQIKQLPKFLNKLEKLQLTAALVILIVSSIALGWRFYLSNSVAIPDYGGSYTEGLIGAPHLVNPILATTDVDRDLVKLMFSGLMKYDENGELIPDLASGYTIDAEHSCRL